jgi:hypothetical protein
VDLIKSTSYTHCLPSRVRQCFLVGAAFAIILAATRVAYLGDTSSYAEDIAEHLGMPPFEHGSSLWESGHLIWRPLGWLLATLASPALARVTDWTPFMQAAFVLIAVSILSSIVAVVLWYLILVELTQSPTIAFLVALSVACGDGFLLYAHSGCSYIPGVTCLTASLYCLRKRILTEGAIFYALAAVLWLPFILTGLALALMAAGPADWDVPLRSIWPVIKPGRAVRFAAISAAVVIALYCLALAARRTTSIADAKVWFFAASHGYSRTLKAVRAITGLPRSFFFLGNDGILFKRFLKHDPYAPVALTDLLRASLWKIAVFYLFVVSLVWELWRRSQSGWPLVLLLTAAGPVIFFAIFLFEPSEYERYLPVFPFLVLATGWIFRDFSAKPRAAQLIVAGSLLCVVLSNGYAFAAPRVASEDDASWRRMASLRGRISGASVAMVTTNQDKIVEFLRHSIFSSVNKPQIFRVYDIAEPGLLRMLQWREQFAAEVFNVWKDGGEVWISKRVWSARPRPDWNWVEGDDPLEVWSDFSGFFRPLQTDADLDGSDGFARLARNDVNIRYLTPVAAAYKPVLAVASQ